MDYEKKYYKYKEKYLELKKMKASGYFIPRGPMIGYPAVPFVSPQVRVTGPIPQIYPGVRAISPISPIFPPPFILGPRLIRVTETESPKCPAPASHKVYLNISVTELKKVCSEISDNYKFLLVDSCDARYIGKVLKELRKIPTLQVTPNKLASPQMQLEYDLTNINAVLTNLDLPNITSPLIQVYNLTPTLHTTWTPVAKSPITITFEQA